MTIELEEEIHASFQIEDGEESVQRVKQIVHRLLSGMDETVRVVKTGYFNHSYVPDIVLEWPARGVGVNRYLYLRPTSDPLKVDVDVRELARERPMFVHLESFDYSVNGGSQGTEVLSQSARKAGTLVTELAAFEQLSTQADSPVSKVLPQSVLRGGIGLIEEPNAREVVDVVNRGFEGAMSADGTSTNRAVNMIENVLDQSTRSELTSLLESIWIASGGHPNEFPRPIRNLGAHMSPDRLLLLINTVGSSNDNFWRRLGETVTFESFSGLNLVGEQVALQKLMETALPRLRARICRIAKYWPPGQNNPFSWQVENGSVALRGFGRRAWIANQRDDLPESFAAEHGVMPSSVALVDRAKVGRVVMSAVELVKSGRSVTYRTENGRDIVGEELVEALNAALGTESKVKRAIALLDESQPVVIDYMNNLAFGRGRSRIDLPSLIWTTWMMLDDVDDRERQVLQALLKPFGPRFALDGLDDDADEDDWGGPPN